MTDPTRTGAGRCLFLQVTCTPGRLLVMLRPGRGAAHPARSNPPHKAFSYQSLLRLTTRTSQSMTGTSISTPTTVASAAPLSKP